MFMLLWQSYQGWKNSIEFSDWFISSSKTKFTVIREKNFTLVPWLLEEFGSSIKYHIYSGNVRKIILPLPIFPCVDSEGFFIQGFFFVGVSSSLSPKSRLDSEDWPGKNKQTIAIIIKGELGRDIVIWNFKQDFVKLVFSCETLLNFLKMLH